ncbi:MAG: LysM peptidoglycan-binding domain-containing protein [Burkholderiales bacterium]
MPELKSDAPESYVVQYGDTLWGIASRYLKEPWRWPELWRFNEQQVRNPHELRPGQILTLDRTRAQLSSRDEAEGAAGLRVNARGETVLSPRVRAEQQTMAAIASIPANVIEPWLSRPLIIEAGQLANAPRIFASEEGRYNLGTGGKAYVDGLPPRADGSGWHIYRTGRPMIDPESKQTLGFEAVYVGAAHVLKYGDPSTIRVRSAAIEVSPGDRLVLEEQNRIVNYMPRPAGPIVKARIISIYGGRGDSSILDGASSEKRIDVSNYDARREAGPMQIVSINRGKSDGVEPGHVLALHRSTDITYDRSVGNYYLGEPRRPVISLPEERYGLVFVFRTFERVSYGLIVQAERPAMPGDVARAP